MQTATLATIYDELGVKPVINARGHNTVLGGSTPSPRVKQAMEDAERYYVDMQDLLRRSGEMIADLIECEAAYVTSGAAAALALGTAACLTGTDLGKMAQLPDTSGLKNRVLLQRRHHYAYERAVTIVGTRLIDVGDEAGTTAAQLEAALTPEVATVLYPAHLEGTEGTLPLAEVIALAHRRGVPVLVDAAGRVYPLALFKSYTKLGADLVAFGAKYFGAPQSSGILCGKKTLVDAAVPQGFIGFETVANRQSFGRPFKLDRQEIIAVVVALQEWMALDHDARLAELERRLRPISDRLAEAPGVTTTLLRADGPAARVLRIRVDSATGRRDLQSVVSELRAGSPAIAVGVDDGALYVNPATVLNGDEAVIADRLGRLLS